MSIEAGLNWNKNYNIAPEKGLLAHTSAAEARESETCNSARRCIWRISGDCNMCW